MRLTGTTHIFSDLLYHTTIILLCNCFLRLTWDRVNMYIFVYLSTGSLPNATIRAVLFGWFASDCRPTLYRASVVASIALPQSIPSVIVDLAAVDCCLFRVLRDKIRVHIYSRSLCGLFLIQLFPTTYISLNQTLCVFQLKLNSRNDV